jgi:predicted GH43/DUF377 family glycosyl hydrolase
VHRTALTLRPDPARVLVRLFLPGQELLGDGTSRADAVIARVLEMDDAQTKAVLADTLERFEDRHHDLTRTFREHYALVAHRIPRADELSADQQDLVGAYFTQEYALEGAALFNPSLVPHPDQEGLAEGELRFVMSLRAVGEGHISSIEFRTGVLGALGDVRVDDPAPYPTTGRVSPTEMSSDRRADPAQPAALAHPDGRDAAYVLSFDPQRPLSARVVFPTVAVESHGVEDARFVAFTDEGDVTYHATYTAYDGAKVAPRLLSTTDWVTFRSRPQRGPAARDKGMALFPRKVDGRHLALTRWDRESLGVTSSEDAVTWLEPVTLARPERPWELIQLGQCGPPLETASGWLVLTHGVGPMRTYGIGALLLDLDDPTVVVGVLDEPFLTPAADERDGYVPNVVYSCGALLHGDRLVVPYGCSDSFVRFAFVELQPLLDLLTTPPG